MATNTLLTPQMITREALRILHQKCNFIGNVTRGYDGRFAQSGAKIGDTLDIRLPNEYVVTDGRVMADPTPDTVEQKVSLEITSQKHVGMEFSSAELTLDLDDFSNRIIEPAMARLAATMEQDALSMINQVYNTVDNDGSATTFKKILEARKKVVDSLAPTTDGFACILNTQDNVDLVDGLKGLFQDSTQISKQYREGMLGRTGGADFYENTLLQNFTSGTAAAATGYLVDGASQSGSTLTIDTGSTTLLVGDVITIAGVNRVHPETKADTGELQQFVVTANSGTSATSLSISPAIVTSGGRQNVTGAPADNAAISSVLGNAGSVTQSLYFHKEAFAFGSADLVMPQGVDFGAREVMDGLSMRIIRDYDVRNDLFPCRVDVLYGYVPLRPQLASKIWSN